MVSEQVVFKKSQRNKINLIAKRAKEWYKRTQNKPRCKIVSYKPLYSNTICHWCIFFSEIDRHIHLLVLNFKDVSKRMCF